MMDQANELRNLVKGNVSGTPNNLKTLTSRVITITSGKGGVGKTNFAVNLAINLSKKNKKVIILDADFGLANIEVLLGVIPKFNLSHVFSGTRTISEIISDGPMGVKFLSGGSGLRDLANMTQKQLSFIIENFDYLDSISDIIIIDTAAGISDTVINFVRASSEAIIITTPEPTSITDAYAIMKSVKEDSTDIGFKIVINRVDSDKEGIEIFNKLNKVCERFLSIKLESLGSIPYDNHLIKAVKRQEPVSICFPNSAVSKSLENISHKILYGESSNQNSTDGIKSFLKRLIKTFNN